MGTESWVRHVLLRRPGNAPEGATRDEWGRHLPSDLTGRVCDMLEQTEDPLWLAAWYELAGLGEAAERLWVSNADTILDRWGVAPEDRRPLRRVAAWLSVGLRSSAPATDGEAARWICRQSRRLHRNPLYIAGGLLNVMRWTGLSRAELAPVSRRLYPYWGTLYHWRSAMLLACKLRPEAAPEERIREVWELRREAEQQAQTRWKTWEALRRLSRRHCTTEAPGEVRSALAQWSSCPLCLNHSEDVVSHVWREHLTSTQRRCRTCDDFLTTEEISSHACLAELGCPLDGTEQSRLTRWNPRGFRHFGTLIMTHDIVW